MHDNTQSETLTYIIEIKKHLTRYKLSDKSLP